MGHPVPIRNNTIMKKKLVLLCFLFTAICTFVNAQSPPQARTSVPIDSRLFQAFDGNYLNNLQTTNPFLLQRWNFYLDNSWMLTTLPPEKASAGLPSIQLADLENINIFLVEQKFQLKADWEKQMVYKVEGTDKALVLIPRKEFNQRLNDHVGRKK